MKLLHILAGRTETPAAGPESLEDQEIRESRPFYWFVELVIVVIYGWVLLQAPEVRAPGVLALFTFLMVAHGWLHWISPYLQRRRDWLVAYFVVQGALVFVINMVVHNQTPLFGLYMALVGESAGSLERPRPVAAGAIGYLALMAVNAAILSSWQTVLSTAIYTVPMVLFVVIYVSIFLRQMKARHEAQVLLRELEEAHRRLSEYAEKVESLTLAAERQRMARELHDTLAQGLAGLILQLEALEAQLGKGEVTKAALIAGQAKDRARATLTEARRTIDDLRSRPDLSDPLPDVLRREVERFSTATGIPCALDLPEGLSLPAALAENVARCIGEGLTNVARHARASSVEVSITQDGPLVTVTVRDDGIGFDPAVAEGQPGHYGLLGLRERARIAGGSLEVESAPGAGTTLRLRVPAAMGEVPA